jgi:polysaccharide pyruvyl transferase WcaK-like protein
MNSRDSGGSIHTVTLLGSSSGRNAGDAALMAAIQASVNRSLGRTLRFEIPTICPSYIRNNYSEGAVPVGMLPWNLSVKMLGLPTWRSIARADLSLVFDAILFDRALYNPLFNFLSTLRLLMPAAKRRGRRMACYNVGTGPVTTPAGRRMLRELMEIMDFITVRDSDSRDLLLEIGVKNPRLIVTADAAINAPACDDARADAILRDAGADPKVGEPLLAVNINHYLDSWAGTGRAPLTRDRFLGVYAEALERIGAETGARMVFVCTQHADVPITRELMGRLKKVRPAGLVTNVEHNHVEIKGVLRRVGLLFGMRLHAMILGSSEGTPICGLAYQPKIHHYYSRIGLRERSLGFEDFSVDSLAAHVTRAWNDRALLRAHLAAVMPELQRDAHTPAALVLALDRGEDLDAAIARLRPAART